MFDVANRHHVIQIDYRSFVQNQIIETDVSDLTGQTFCHGINVDDFLGFEPLAKKFRIVHSGLLLGFFFVGLFFFVFVGFLGTSDFFQVGELLFLGVLLNIIQSVSIVFFGGFCGVFG